MSHLNPEGEGGKKLGQDDVSDEFSSYINRARAIIRTTSTVGSGPPPAAVDSGVGKSPLRLDSFNDKVTRYIDRSKITIRMTSTVGSGASTN